MALARLVTTRLLATVRLRAKTLAVSRATAATKRVVAVALTCLASSVQVVAVKLKAVILALLIIQVLTTVVTHLIKPVDRVNPVLTIVTPLRWWLVKIVILTTLLLS
ncbi:hypothetical protein [Phormidesmis priestleyi]|uniref:hypothetical protein n=1 Tax=Phormidesmis priestleyi TaxID=268141 RepID=UPI00083A1273|nr:hypothetical protein [Phormidesmis priestleyi]